MNILSFPVSFNVSGFKIRDLEFASFIMAILIYALLGSPTPDNPGWVELLIAALLITAFFRPGLGVLVRFRVAVFFLIYGLSVPFLVGVINGNGLGQIIRDLMAFLFLVLPFFAVGFFRDRPERIYTLIAVFVVLGVSFAARSILDVMAIFPQDLTYFSITPGVLFACVFLLGMAVSIVSGQQSVVRCIGLAVVCIVLALIPFMAMAMTLQRASVAIVILMVGLMLVWLLVYRPARAVLFMLLLLIPVVIFQDYFMDLYESLSRKNLLLGSNNRIGEVQAVWDVVSGSPLSVLFGVGWGGMFESPAVGMVRVNFTHSLLTSMILKTGLVGFGLMMVYLFYITQNLFRVLLFSGGLGLALSRGGGSFKAAELSASPRSRALSLVSFSKEQHRWSFALGLALVGPLMVDVFLYASYKSFDFGLLLLLIVVAGKVLPIETSSEEG